MPRRPRLHLPGGFYHITLRGNHRRAIFHRPDDRAVLEQFVAESCRRHGVRVHAYCWMTNHIHLLAQVSDTPIGPFMQRIASRYARTIQARVPTTGHLFERRYQALLVDADAYLVQLVRYIHQNPLRARMVRDPGNYPWSSHRSYAGLENRPWLTTDAVLQLFDSTRTSAIVAYRRFMAGAKTEPGLVQQLTNPADDRLLGDDAFAAKVTRIPSHPSPRMTLDEIIGQVCSEQEVEPAALRSPNRARHLGDLRVLVAQRALDAGVASLSEVARNFARDESSLRKALQRRTAAQTR